MVYLNRFYHASSKVTPLNSNLKQRWVRSVQTAWKTIMQPQVDQGKVHRDPAGRQECMYFPWLYSHTTASFSMGTFLVTGNRDEGVRLGQDSGGEEDMIHFPSACLWRTTCRVLPLAMERVTQVPVVSCFKPIHVQTHRHTQTWIIDCKLAFVCQDCSSKGYAAFLGKHLSNVADKQMDKCRATWLHRGTFLCFPLYITVKWEISIFCVSLSILRYCYVWLWKNPIYFYL